MKFYSVYIDCLNRLYESLQTPRHNSRVILFSCVSMEQEGFVRGQDCRSNSIFKIEQQCLRRYESIHRRFVGAEVGMDLAWSSASSEHVVEMVARLEIT